MNFVKPHKISTHSEIFYFHFFYPLSDWVSSEGFDANLLEVQVENMLSSPKEPTFTLHNTLGPYGLKYIDHKREKKSSF